MTRRGKRGQKAYEERVHYISSLQMTAVEFGQKIREHWLIENQLHWTKDVLLEEDKSKIKAGMSAKNFSIIHSIVLNLFQKHWDISPTKTQRIIANNIKHLRGETPSVLSVYGEEKQRLKKRTRAREFFNNSLFQAPSFKGGVPFPFAP